MTAEKLEMLKGILTCAYEIEVRCSAEDIPDCEFVLDDEAFEFIRDLVLEQEARDEFKTNFDRGYRTARNVYTQERDQALQWAEKLAGVLAGYHEYFTAIERGEYEKNRRTKPLRGFEDMLQYQAKEALTEFNQWKEKG